MKYFTCYVVCLSLIGQYNTPNTEETIHIYVHNEFKIIKIL